MGTAPRGIAIRQGLSRNLAGSRLLNPERGNSGREESEAKVSHNGCPIPLHSASREEMMTSRQLVALENPCIEAEQCAEPIYRKIIGRWSTILTMNVGFE